MLVVILATADFDAPLLTNKQQIAHRLSATHRVIYVNSLGLRKPKLNIYDFNRILGRLRSVALSFIRRGNVTDTNYLSVIQPLVLPFHNSRLARLINKALLTRQIAKILEVNKSSQNCLWTFTPTTYGIESLFQHTVYHSVDLLHTVPGIDPRQTLLDEKKLIHNASLLIASSTGVEKHLADVTSKPIRLWENVADTKMFARHHSAVRKNQVVYFGNLTDVKMDIRLLVQVAESGQQLIVVGPTGIDGTFSSGALQLSSYSNVELRPAVSQEDMARICGVSKIGLIPYAINSHTAGIFPLKVYEYLSSGMTVVSTRLPSLLHVSHPRLRLVSGEEFANTVEHELINFTLSTASDNHVVSNNSWEHRLDQINHELNELSKLGPS
jgi:teichuronic acid biosynthesis glycosyltransferase TuaH